MINKLKPLEASGAIVVYFRLGAIFFDVDVGAVVLVHNRMNHTQRESK